MPAMELTPELFEKTEFTERRKGYDIDQVERFLEEAGTELAKLLVQVRRTEERAQPGRSAFVPGRCCDLRRAERGRGGGASGCRTRRAASGAASGLSEEAEVAQAAKTLLMARRTAEATEAEARSQAQALLAETKSRADRQLSDSQAESEELVRSARRRADEEFAERRSRVLEDVENLEGRRTQLADIVGQLEGRLASYREDLTRTADELTLLASDPDRLGARPPLSFPADEVFTSSVADEPFPSDFGSEPPEPTRSVRRPDTRVGRVPAEEQESPIEATSMTAEVRAVTIDADGGPPTEAVAPAQESDLADDDAAPARDRYLQDLDDAVNESADSDDAMSAFFEGSNESPNRRFGWRR